MRIGIIAAGGNSRRTGLGDYTTKAALLLADKPLLVHQLDFLQRSGFERAIVVCQPKHARLLSSLLDEEQRAMTAFLFTEAAGGWGGKIERAIAWLSDHDEIAIISCDNYHTTPEIVPLKGNAPAHFSYTYSGDKALTNGPVFGRAVGETRWHEQPGTRFHGELFTGYVVARGVTLRRALSQVALSSRGEKEITSLLACMWKEGSLMPVPYDGTYEDVADLPALARIHAGILGRDQTITGIGAGVLLHTKNLGDRVLLTERQDGWGWVPPGGSVDEGESFAQAAARELKEEIGYNVSPSTLRLLGVYPTTGKTGKAACSVIFHHYVDAPPNLFPDKREVQALGWFTREECSQLKIPFDLHLAVRDHFDGKELDCR